MILNHLNGQEPGVIKFTKEEEEDNRLAVLDLELNVNRKRKRIEFNVHYKPTNTNITIKKRSNHRDSTKRGVIKGYGDKARALCDQQYLEEELKNIEDVFTENGYARQEVRNALSETHQTRDLDRSRWQETRGIVSLQNIPKFTQIFSRIAGQHRFRTTTKAENKVRDITSKARTPLGDKNTHVAYNIACGCGKYSYTGETHRMWETRKKEHMDKVRLTKQDLEKGNNEMAERRMNTGDGGLAKHSSACEIAVMWEESKIVGKERHTAKRKYLEGIETLKEKSKGVIPLNSFNQMEHGSPPSMPFWRRIRGHCVCHFHAYHGFGTCK